MLEIALQDHHGGHFIDDFFTLLAADICGDELFLRHHRRQTFIPKVIRNIGEGSRKQRLLQDVFLTSVRDANVQVTMFLVNGVMLQGRIAAFDLFCMLLEREGYVQLAYKHAVSTIQPVTPVDLTGDWDGEEGEDYRLQVSFKYAFSSNDFR